MKKAILPAVLLAALSTAAYAEAPQSDAREAHENSVKTSVVSYTCRNGGKVKVTYGFNKQNLPTYAEAYLNGKRRFMPINLYRSDKTDTVFGDENNFSLGADGITFKNHRRTAIATIQDPAGEILYKGCNPVRQRQKRK